MNENHKYCGSDEWRAVVRESLIPWALGDGNLGDDVIEVGPGYGATTDVLSESAPRVTAVEVDPDLAGMLRERFAAQSHVAVVTGDATALEFPADRFTGAACFNMLHHVPTAELQDRLFSEVARVLRPGGLFVAGDSVPRADLEAYHQGDTYNPVDPEDLEGRLRAAGFTDVEVKTNELGWASLGRKPVS